MTVYQLHEYSGQWEDFRDYIIGSYLSKERAEEAKAQAEAKEKELIEHTKKCSQCPFLRDDDSNLDDLMTKHFGYCSEVKLVKDRFGIDCENYYLHWDESIFTIKEIEVEE